MPTVRWNGEEAVEAGNRAPEWPFRNTHKACNPFRPVGFRTEVIWQANRLSLYSPGEHRANGPEHTIAARTGRTAGRNLYRADLVPTKTGVGRSARKQTPPTFADRTASLNINEVDDGKPSPVGLTGDVGLRLCRGWQLRQTSAPTSPSSAKYNGRFQSLVCQKCYALPACCLRTIPAFPCWCVAQN